MITDCIHWAFKALTSLISFRFLSLPVTQKSYFIIKTSYFLSSDLSFEICAYLIPLLVLPIHRITTIIIIIIIIIITPLIIIIIIIIIN